ncbi:MAG TPA: hypothetical protein VJ870_18500 [Amycolatopsis sp.]|nr:hypothetical protein [Amycolatopsis sp.]
MTGPEHYRKAEALLAKGSEDPTERGASRLAAAEVHATLALAAATALGADLEMPDFGAWRRVASRGRGGGL